METFKAVFFKPDPAAQKRKCDQLIRANQRQLDRQISNLKQEEIKARKYILEASKRGQKDAARTIAKELVKVQKQSTRLHTSRAQLSSVQMQVSEAFSVRKIEGSLKASTGIMKDVNTLVRLPELTTTMQQLSAELMKAGIIEEMVGDTLANDDLLEEDEAAESEVNDVLAKILKERMPKTAVPEQQLPQEPVEAEDDLVDQEESLAQMRGRLEALKS